MVALEAMLCGANDVRIRLMEGWICISAEIDWLGDNEVEVFERLMPFRQGGPNAVTSEFLAVVFSRSVVTGVNDSVRCVKGDSLGPAAVLEGVRGRVVAFEL
ncbi:hypothetical protein [Catenuloplanes indicus]|uniref:Uncharacterized protein n=1 Tax=Catenuloplanes indicus TaxID=137267 RepID=A0AAE3VVV4_9ACTN|nr:hypothetical protein [Catenuloplanes indicus]MDQ0364776.1 hypothetical protein [Catenuloplanes indicus]